MFIYLFNSCISSFAFNKGKILKDISVTNDIFYKSLVVVMSI